MIEITPQYLASQGLSESFPKRFWAKVNKNGPVPSHQPELGPCWVWTGCISPQGYGRIGKGPHQVSMSAHVASWIINSGPITEGQFVLHKCDNRPCIRPEHLFLGTSQDNLTDAALKGRMPRGSRHWNCGVSEAQVLEIRSMYVKGKISMQRIGDMYGVHGVTIWDIIHRRTWNHI